MTRYEFAPAQVVEWLDIPTVTRILSITHADVLQLVEAGRLRARNVAGEPRIDSASVDAYSESLPAPIAAPPARTYVKVAGRAYEEVATASGTKLIPV